jgi:lipopolysaccharide transport system permease protein
MGIRNSGAGSPVMTTMSTRSANLRSFNPLAMLRNLWCHRELIAQFARRDVEGRYRGSFLGVIWSFLTPLVMLLIYTFVFGLIFQSRWPQARSSSLNEFAVILFAGLITFTIFSECVTRAPGLVVAVPNYVKKVVFPLEILPVSTLGAALFHAAVSTLILLAAHLLSGGTLHVTLLLLPLVLLPVILLSLGLGWLLASLGVFIRDIGNLTGLLVQILFFLTPIFYTVDAIPERYRNLLLLNPLGSAIGDVRRVVLWGEPPAWGALAVSLLLSLIVTIAGYAWFMQTKKGFADVL